MGGASPLAGPQMPASSQAQDYMAAASERLAAMVPILRDIRDDLRSNLRFG
jgi:hypothetical protein